MFGVFLIVGNKSGSTLMRFLAQTLSKFYWNFPHFKGEHLALRVIFRALPSYRGYLRHSLGFNWFVNNREELWTFIVSCEKHTTKILLKEIESSDTFISIGANFGWYPLVVSSRKMNVKVYGFECNSQVSEQFLENINFNNYEVISVKSAVSDFNGKLNLFKLKNANDGMSTLFPTDAYGGETEIVEFVESTTLDLHFKDKMGNLGNTLVLMDIEGSELKALIGAEEFFSEVNPVLICEINPILIQASGHSYLEVFNFLESKGYKSFWIDERGAMTQVKDPANLPHLEVLPDGTGANYLFKKF
jgi:FkbM family methyltransferase